MISDLLNKLIEFKTISDKFISIQQNLKNFDSDNEIDVIDLKLCKSKVEIWGTNLLKRSRRFRAKCEYNINKLSPLNMHRLDDNNQKQFNWN